MKFSASMIGTWASCAMQAKFSYLDRLPQKQSASATFGTCVHEALEQYNAHGNADKAVARFEATWASPELLDAVPDVWHPRVTYGGLRETGVKIIREYADQAAWHKREVIAAEHRFCVPFGRHLLSGIVDQLEANPDGSLRVVDYKTAGKQPNRDSLYLNLQFTIYHFASLQPEFWLGYDDGTDGCRNKDGSLRYPGFANGEELWDRFKDAPRHVIWYHLRTNKELDAGPRDDPDYLRLLRCCDEIEKAITHEVFVPTVSGDSCTFCSYHEQCTSYVPPPNQEY